MKWFILINILLLLESSWAHAKQEKFVKKPTNLKPTKKVKSIIDEFSGLAPDDLEFIKQLDKQFKIHGDKIKIKVEQDNSTNGKNSKRTIDGNLGYGYHQGDQNNYYFTQAKYMNGYSQENGATQDREIAHSIEIQPSHSYEIKENINEGYDTQYQQQQYEAVPVIVLKIPGPTKYALHLQALLQQYLELRASHLLQMLQEQDDQGLLPQLNGNSYIARRPVQYVPMTPQYNTPNYNYYNNEQSQYQQAQYQQAQYQQQLAYYQQQQQYYNQQQAQKYQQQVQYEQYAYQQQPQSQYAAEQEQQSYETPNSYVEPQYEQPQQNYANYVTLPPPEEHVQEEPHTELQTSENYPSDAHTQVIFKKKIKTTVHPGYHYSKPTAVVHHGYQDEQPGDFYDLEHKEYASDATMLSVTQRARAPYNYHARATYSTVSPSTVTITTRNSKRDAPFTEEQFKKVKRIVSKMKRVRVAQRQTTNPQEQNRKAQENKS
jgi:hypothetical protein